MSPISDVDADAYLSKEYKNLLKYCLKKTQENNIVLFIGEGYGGKSNIYNFKNLKFVKILS